MHTPAITEEQASRASEDLADYRALSIPAVVSLVLGLAAPLGLFAPLLLGVAFLGAMVALVALRRIAASDGMMTGRGVALVGLALCVASAGAVVSRAVLTKHLLARQANQLATQWFELLQAGSPEQAFELTVDSVSPPRPRTEHDHDHQHHAHGPGEEAHEHAPSPLEQFLDDPFVGRLMRAGPGAVVRLDGDLAYAIDQNAKGTLEQRFRVSSAGDPSTFFVRLTLQRAFDRDTGQLRWRVLKFEGESEPAAAADRG
jgi:hypothetical protein